MIKKIILSALIFGAAMAVQAKTYIVDVRTPAELQQTGRVEGALNADFRAPDFVDHFKALNIPKTDEVLLYCRSGARAGNAKTILGELGYQNVKNLGGYESAARILGRPLVK